MTGRSSSTLALLCPQCGKLEVHSIFRFTFQKPEQHLSCSCGQILLSIVSSNKSQYLLKVNCIICQEEHLVLINRNDLWNSFFSKIYCNHTNTELGMIGSEEEIENRLSTQNQTAIDFLEELSDHDESSVEIFNDIKNPSVMLEVLNKINDLAVQDCVYCHCSSNEIEINILSDSIEIICSECNSKKIIPASSNSDQTQIQKISYLEINAPKIKFN
ncbi:hypothetical protein LJC10_00240 [Selenomonadales bacterium OttesenSCG-928-I06]|nr:hypothetical protein [Selenomonadales bacterium OttesenSCG-928-I06]